MKNILLALLLVATHSLAQADSHKDTAYKLLEAMKIDAQLEAMAENIKNLQARQLSQLAIPQAAQPIVNDYLTKTQQLLVSTFKSDTVREAYANAYTSVFTEAELKQVLAFYTSPSGKKFLEKQPELNQQVLKVAEQQVAAIQPQIQALRMELQEKLQPYQPAQQQAPVPPGQ